MALLFLLIDIVEDPESRLSHSDAEGLGNLGKGSVSELSREHTKHTHFRKKRRRLNVHVWQLSAHIYPCTGPLSFEKDSFRENFPAQVYSCMRKYPDIAVNSHFNFRSSRHLSNHLLSQPLRMRLLNKLVDSFLFVSASEPGRRLPPR